MRDCINPPMLCERKKANRVTKVFPLKLQGGDAFSLHEGPRSLSFSLLHQSGKYVTSKEKRQT